MKNDMKLTKQLNLYLQWPMLFGIFLAAVSVWTFNVDINKGIVLTCTTVLYYIMAIGFYLYQKTNISQDLVAFAIEYAKTQKQLLQDLAIPYCLMDHQGKIFWLNAELQKLINTEHAESKYINHYFPEILPEHFNMESDFKQIEILHEGRNYRLELKKLIVTGQDQEFVQTDEYNEYLISMYFFDETEMKRLIKRNHDQKMVSGLVYIDNHEEALESVEDVKRSLLMALIDRKIKKYFTSMNGIVKTLEKDRYFIAIEQSYVSVLQSNKFSILDEVKNVNIGNKMAITISIGLGVNGENYLKNNDYARIAIDLALGRGGDQAVIKDGGKIYYYGGKSKQVEKNTRVKARVKAHALRELLETKDKIFVMGHKIGDIDSLGASIGICIAARYLNKKAYIILNDITTSVRPMMDRLLSTEEYTSEIFLTGEQALEQIEDNVATVLVDVNRASYVECPELLPLSKCVVVLDHHRQSSEIIENALLSYNEPYASSACEMVAEILQYIHDDIKLKPVEADALYAGIVMDTNNFTNKTGVRTFEAAAFLKRNGADITRVRKQFRDELVDYRARAEAVRLAEVFEGKFAFSVCPSENLESPTVVGAQAANELLNIRGIKASFVVTEFNGKVFISARSIDEINVQLIMERLGGGGHMNMAGTQLQNCSVEDAKDIIMDTVREMLSEGDI